VGGAFDLVEDRDRHVLHRHVRPADLVDEQLAVTDAVAAGAQAGLRQRRGRQERPVGRDVLAATRSERRAEMRSGFA
jgi:hypothetical protein